MTSSSRREAPLGLTGGMILYVMRTFLAFLHMGRVECVTDQVPLSHSSGGGVKIVDERSLELYFFGDRRVIEVLEGSSKGGAEEVSTVIVVPPGDSPGKAIEFSERTTTAGTKIWGN